MVSRYADEPISFLGMSPEEMVVVLGSYFTLYVMDQILLGVTVAAVLYFLMKRLTSGKNEGYLYHAFIYRMAKIDVKGLIPPYITTWED